MKPDARQHNQDPQYFTDLVRSAGLPVTRLAKVIGHDDRTIRRWMSGERPFPYSVQFTLECLVLMP
jgi:hypothetical protein